MNSDEFLKIDFSPENWTFFLSFQVERMLEFLICKEYRSLGVYANLFPMVWRALKFKECYKNS